MFDSPTESLFDFSTASDETAVKDTVLAGFERLAQIYTEREGEDVTILDVIDGFIGAYQFARLVMSMETGAEEQLDTPAEA